MTTMGTYIITNLAIDLVRKIQEIEIMRHNQTDENLGFDKDDEAIQTIYADLTTAVNKYSYR